MAVIHTIVRSDPMSWGLMPYMVHRIMRFCENYDTHTKPVELVEQILRLFATGDPRLGLWAVLQDMRIVGHVLAQPEPITLDRGPWPDALIRQVETDEKVDIRKEGRELFTLVKDWAIRLNIPRLVIVTHRNAAAMSRSWGFKKYKLIMDLDIGVPESLGSGPP